MNAPVPQLPLRDIHLPDPVSWWPPAPGWWFLVASLIVGAVLAVLAIRYWRNLTRVRRVSLHEIGAIQDAFYAHRDPVRLVRELSVFLRRVCVSRHPRIDVASLTGAEWMSFLDRPLDGRPFAEGKGKVLATAPYQQTPDVDADELLSLCRAWVAALPTQKER